MAEALLRGSTDRPRARRIARSASGYDLHRLVEGRPLILGGVTIPFERGPGGPLRRRRAVPRGHRRGARRRGARRHRAALSRHRSARGRARRASSCCGARSRSSAQAGYAVVNVDAVVIAERPKLAPHVDGDARERWPRALGVDRRARQREGQDQRGRRTRSAAARRSPCTRSRCSRDRRSSNR